MADFLRYLSSTFLVVTLAIFSFSCTTSGLEVVQTIEEDFDDIRFLIIESGFLDVSYLGVPQQQEMKLAAVLSSDTPGKHEIVYAVSGDTLTIKIKNNNARAIAKSQGFLNLTGPIRQEVQIESESGALALTFIVGRSIKVELGSGEIQAKDIFFDEILFRAKSGLMNVESLDGDFISLAVDSGKLTAKTISGRTNANVNSGNMFLENVIGRLNVSMSSGKAELKTISELGFFLCGSGEVTATNSGLGANTKFDLNTGTVSVQTTSKLEDFNYQINIGNGKVTIGSSTSSTDLNLQNGSDKTIIGQVGSGSLTIRN